jgi:RNA polymerase sigma factor (sigma-70 family)
VSTNTEDASLLAAWRSGDREAGRELVDRHYAAIARFFHNKVTAEADDLVHRTFLACVEAKAPFRGESSFRTYLFAIARNELYAHYRRARRVHEELAFDTLSVADLGESPSQIIARAQEQRLLLEGLRRIPVSAQIALELSYWEGLTTKEIAEVLGIPHGTVRSRIRAARHALEAAIASISRSRAVLESTVDNLERWLSSMRGRVP